MNNTQVVDNSLMKQDRGKVLIRIEFANNDRLVYLFDTAGQRIDLIAM